MGRKFWFLWMPTMKDLCNLCMLESMLNSWFVNKLFWFVLFLFCKQTAEEQRLHLRSSMYDVAFLIWFTAFVCFLNSWILPISTWFFLFIIVIELYPPYRKILHDYWPAGIVMYLVFTKCNGRDFFYKRQIRLTRYFFRKINIF